MPDRTTKPIGKTVQRGTVCKDRWQATVTVLAPDRIPTGETAFLFLSISWRDERGAQGRPEDAKPTTLRFEPKRQTGGGDIVFDNKDGPHEKGFETDTTTTLTLFGKAASGGTEADVDLVVRIEDEEQARLPMSVGKADITVTIASASADPLPNYLAIDQSINVKAVVAPPTPGTFRWLSPIAKTLEFTNTTPAGETQITLKTAPPRSVRFVPAVVVFQPQGKETIYIGTHQFDARESIAFAMGDPEPVKKPNLFYRGGIAYLLLNPIGDLELYQRSLLEIKQYLENHPPQNGLPWGDIHILSHANEEGWMQAKVVPKGEDADPITLSHFVESGEFVLPDSLLDKQSVLRIRGCAVGRSPEMMQSLSKAFGGKDAQRPIVIAPMHIQAYHFDPRNAHPDGPMPTSAEEYLRELFILGYPSDQVPSDKERRAQFTAAYPNVGINWNKVKFETDVRTLEIDKDQGWEYIPIPKDDKELVKLVNKVVVGGPVSSATITDKQTFKEEDTGLTRTRLIVSYTQKGQDFSGLDIEAGPNPPSDKEGRLKIARERLETDWGAAAAARFFTEFSWTPTVTDKDIGGGHRQFTITFKGSRTIYRFLRDLTEPDPDNPAKQRRAHPPITDRKHFTEVKPE
jgi:hypothetical protein